MSDDSQNFQLLNEKALASVLAVSPRTLRTWRKEGRLPYIRVSPGVVRYELSEVRAALNERKVNARKTNRLETDDD